MSGQTFLVRLKPYAPKQGYFLKTFVHRGIVFKVESGWYQVDAQLAEELREIHTKPENLDSMLAFDVCTKEEASEKVETERRLARPDADVSAPIQITSVRPQSDTSGDLSTDDLAEAAVSVSIPGSPGRRAATARRVK